MHAVRVTIVMASLLVTGACRHASSTTMTGEGQTIQVSEPSEPKIAAAADAPLRAMSEYVAGLDQFSLHTTGSLEVVLTDGQKLEFPFDSEVWVDRPAQLRSDRVVGDDRLQFYYDGQTFTLYSKKAGFYAQHAAPATLDEAIVAMHQQLDLDAPAADLLSDDPYAALTEDVVSGYRVGIAEIEGVRCHHLAFRGNEVDWQIWIEDGPQPRPRRFVITSKQMQGAPQFSVQLSKWDTTPKLRDKFFAFKPPAGAQKIEFLTPGAGTPKQTLNELPEGCTTIPGPAYDCAGSIYRPFYQGATVVYVPGTAKKE